jgi:transcriptional regulator with XRE-family HTH domain
MGTSHLFPRRRHPRQQARVVSGFTQDELALLVGVDRSLLSRWERALLEFSDDVVARIAGVLEVPVDQLTVVDEAVVDEAAQEPVAVAR